MEKQAHQVTFFFHSTDRNGKTNPPLSTITTFYKDYLSDLHLRPEFLRTKEIRDRMALNSTAFL